LLVRSWARPILGDSTSGGGLKGKGKGRHKQWLHSNPDSKIGGGALDPRYDHLPVYRSIGEMSVPIQRIGTPLGVADCKSLAINDISVPRSAREGDPNSSYQILWEDGDRVFWRRRRVGDDGTWSAVLVVLPIAAPVSLKPRSASPRIRIEGCAGRIVGCAAAATSGFPLLTARSKESTRSRPTAMAADWGKFQ
jgi:hypothetical protein